MSTPFTKYIDDLITRLRGGVPTRASAASPDAAEYLRKLEEAAAAARVSEDMARGSTMALRARNAQVDPLVELSGTELPIPEPITPRDVARVRSDEARRDARFGPFEADDTRPQFWDMRRAAERNIDAARAAQIQSERLQPELRRQFMNDATTAAAVLGGGAVAGSALVGALEAGRKANEFVPYTADGAFADPEDASRRPPPKSAVEASDNAATGELGIPMANNAVPLSEEEVLASLQRPDWMQMSMPPVPVETPTAPVAMPRPSAPSDLTEGDLMASGMEIAEDQEVAMQPQVRPAGEGAMFSVKQPDAADRVAADSRYWNDAGVKERKIARMAKAAGLSIEEARALVAEGAASAEGMTDDTYNLTAAGRNAEFSKLRDAVTNRRNANEDARMQSWRAQMMLAGSNPRKNAVNALGALDEDQRQANLQFMLAGGRGATPLEVEAQRALANRGVAEVQAQNEGRMQQLQQELAAKQDMFDKDLAQSNMQLMTERDLSLRRMEEDSRRELAGIRARADAAAAQQSVEGRQRMDEAIARITGGLGQARMEADTSRYRADREAETFAGRYANPAQMALTSAQLANTQADRRRALLEAATNEANNYADDRGAFNSSRFRQWGWDPTLVDANEEGRIRSLLRAMDPQATDQEIETVLEAALRNKTRGR
jgi:hypothetical protein